MRSCVIVDSGALLAFLDPAENRHREVAAAVAIAPLPMWTAESVLSELAWLLRRNGRRMSLVNRIVGDGMVDVVSLFPDHAADIAALMARYDNVPMSFADACLVKLAELHPQASILTLDGDFSIYRRFGNEPLPLLALDRCVQEPPVEYGGDILASSVASPATT